MKKFFKKPLNIISVVVAFLGILGIILTIAIPTGTYTNKTTVGSLTVESGIKLSGGKLITLTKDDGKWEETGLKVDYEIKNGKLTIAGAEIGKINGLKITSTDDDETAVYTNKLAVTFLVISCVFVLAGAAGIVYSTVFGKKKKSSKK